MTYATKAHYEANKQSYIDRAAVRRNRQRAQVNEYKSRTPCMDCGNTYPAYVMDFDHTGKDKVDNVSTMISQGRYSEALKEMEKCELVCSNCHRIRTHNRLPTSPMDRNTAFEAA